MSRRGARRIAAILLAIVMLGAVAACAPTRPTAAELKERCVTNEKLIGMEMKLFYADSGIYPPIATVVSTMKRECPSKGTYAFDEKTGVVTCSVHGHP
jgi:hypothetical protein